VTRGLSSRSSEVCESRVMSRRFFVSCVVSVACLVGLFCWVDAAHASPSTETAAPHRTTQEWRNNWASAALKTDGSVITWGEPTAGFWPRPGRPVSRQPRGARSRARQPTRSRSPDPRP